MKPHIAEAERIQREIICKMSPAKKFAIAYKMRFKTDSYESRSRH